MDQQSQQPEMTSAFYLAQTPELFKNKALGLRALTGWTAPASDRAPRGS